MTADVGGLHDFYAGRCVRCDLRVADAGWTCSGYAVAPTDQAALEASRAARDALWEGPMTSDLRAERDRYREAACQLWAAAVVLFNDAEGDWYRMAGEIIGRHKPEHGNEDACAVLRAALDEEGTT